MGREGVDGWGYGVLLGFFVGIYAVLELEGFGCCG